MQGCAETKATGHMFPCLPGGIGANPGARRPTLVIGTGIGSSFFPFVHGKKEGKSFADGVFDMSRLRFGIWALVHGSRGALQDPDEPFDASWERNKRLVLEAEALGFDSTLIAQHTANPYDDAWDELEAWTAAAALAALTERIEIIAATKPPLYHPVVLAKMALQIEHIAKGRFGINLVNAWNKPEYEKAGIAFAEHDERYAYGREWLAIVEPLLRGERVSASGRYFQVSDYQLRPKDTFRARPAIYVGGESVPAQDLVASLGAVWFLDGQPLAEIERLIAAAHSRTQRQPMRISLLSPKRTPRSGRARQPTAMPAS